MTTNKSCKAIVLRGVSGCGKSFVSEMLNLLPKSTVCSADDYFSQSGEYIFDASKLHLAHKSCQEKFLKALEGGFQHIVVSNVNAKESDFAYYQDTAKSFGADIIFMVIENRHGGENQHSVPLETLQRQEQNIKSSLSL